MGLGLSKDYCTLLESWGYATDGTGTNPGGVSGNPVSKEWEKIYLRFRESKHRDPRSFLELRVWWDRY